ncbi:MAG TPA: AMP-dependent synthetase/ligase, partial [Solirubrobacteraceae bacterium]|nr:AMP-dependent synthetase/ligase [Solirubrobacteraceae bacterium]
YTSGTTGRPKGCMLTHGNYRANSDMCASAVDLGDGATIFVFLPLAHSMTRVITLFALDQGHELAYWRGDLTRVLEDVQEVRPTDLPSVPRLFEKVHQAATSATGARRRLLDWAVARGRAAREAERAGRRLGPAARAQHAVADRLVLRRVRDLFGGRVRMVFTGGAPIEPEILRLFDACGILVLEGYGLTETGAAATMNTASALRLGTVGRALPGGEVRIAGDGEILVAGPHVFGGYLHDDEATAAALRDGWLHSGDLGELDRDGFLRITGRKKDLIVTSTGKNVSPAAIENALRGTWLISQAVVVGDRRPHLAALVTLDPEQAAGLSAEEARAAVGREIDAVNQRFAPPERVRRFAVLDRELSQEEGELTATLKVRRAVVEERFAAEIDALYG